MIVAIDGPAGAGKSTVARELARALGLVFLDTGAMYRAVTLRVLERGVDPSDARACAAVARSLELSFDDAGRIRIDGREGEPAIRRAPVDAAVSAVSEHPAVREAIVEKQRALAHRLGGLVAEGRDTTTVVFPEADHKVFLEASLAERARRRAAQEGAPERADEVAERIRARDEHDSRRACSPLRVAPDAVRVDTEGLSVAGVVERLLAIVRGEGGT